MPRLKWYKGTVRQRKPFPIMPRGIRQKTIKPPPERLSNSALNDSRVSEGERRFAKELERRGIAYEAQASVGGGRQAFGGAVVDFKLPGLKAYVRIQGEHWHQQDRTRARDDAQAIMLRASKWRIIDIWYWDVMHRLDWVMNEVLYRTIS